MRKMGFYTFYHQLRIACPGPAGCIVGTLFVSFVLIKMRKDQFMPLKDQ